MRTDSILPSTLQTFNYYRYKLPLFLQNSYGFLEHYRIWYDFLVGASTKNYEGVVKTSDTILYLLDIFNADYLTLLYNIETETVEQADRDYNYSSDMLDKLASLFTIKREFRITYTDENDIVHTNEQIKLTNSDLLTFIKIQIVQNYFDGSFEELINYCDRANVKYVITNGAQPASADIYLIEIDGSNYVYSDNIKKLFYAGLLRIDSLGITYTNTLLNLDNILVFDKLTTATYTGWDDGEWTI